jgi:hypothetical protein
VREPWEDALAYAYPEIKWDPQPVFQDYAAYTPYLDQLNADFLAGPNAPERILWLTADKAPLAIDGHSLWFESPTARLQMLCRYVPLAATPTWQVLQRVPNRCGAPVRVAAIDTVAGASVSIPGNLPAGVLTLRVSGAGRDLLSRLTSLAYRASPWFVTQGQFVYRLPLGTAIEPMVIGATVDSGYREALALPLPASLSVGPEHGRPGIGSPLTFVLEVIPILSQS